MEDCEAVLLFLCESDARLAVGGGTSGSSREGDMMLPDGKRC